MTSIGVIKMIDNQLYIYPLQDCIKESAEGKAL